MACLHAGRPDVHGEKRDAVMLADAVPGELGLTPPRLANARRLDSSAATSR
jgi:hypothetical protein